MSSTITSTPSASRRAANLSSLPFELIMAILEQCDDYLTLHALRRTCKTFRMYIDNNPSFDNFLFRNRPLTNPILNSVHLIKIRSLPQTEEDKARDRNAELLRGNSCINVHPILSRIGWDLDGHDDDDDDDDDYDDDYDDDLDDDFDDEYDDDDEDGVEADDENDDDNTRGEVYIVNSGLEKKEFPHQLLDECATCPPVYTLQVELDLSNYYHYYEEPNPELDPTSNSDCHNYVGEPVLVRHVMGCLIENSRNLCHRRRQFIVDNESVRR